MLEQLACSWCQSNISTEDTDSNSFEMFYFCIKCYLDNSNENKKELTVEKCVIKGTTSTVCMYVTREGSSVVLIKGPELIDILQT